MNSNEIRQQFLDFFRSKGHAIVDSSPVVPFDDPTLMFTNAGMNQFKDVFLGTGTRAYKRAADTQKCIRAGGKHNDLDDVGQDTYHHTFFEMLGNWSFGDYFKKEAIEWAWELLTKVWGLDPSRLYATYFEGDAGEGLEPDSEAANLWQTRTSIDPSHIIPGNKKDNFWEMGDTGPCGPCSEIHIDMTPDKSGGPMVNKGDARVIEIWNLVFIQFNRGADGKLTPLPAKHVDTGMGFERICAALQASRSGKMNRVSNYDTEVFTPIFAAIQKRTGAPGYRGTLPSDASRVHLDAPTQSTIDNLQSTIMIDVSYRVIADHIRTLTFAITDGATPSNEGRGYVLRRILRRAFYYGDQYMNMHEPFLCDLVQPLVEQMGNVFPELRNAHRGKNIEHVREMIREEEASFLRTLDRGIKLFRRARVEAIGRAYAKRQGNLIFAGVGASAMWEGDAELAQQDRGPTTVGFVRKPDNVPIEIATSDAEEYIRELGLTPMITGTDAFKLHDTYGFPIDLTQRMAQEEGLTIDVDDYERLMEEARELARGEKRNLNDPFDPETYEVLATGETTDDTLKYVEPYECATFIWGHGPKWVGRNDSLIERPSSNVFCFHTNRTPFYAEQGGQVSDTGTLRTDSGAVVEVTQVKRQGNSILHFGFIKSGEIPPGQTGTLRVDRPRRDFIMQNHTATHILNWALREVLELHGGGKVDQKGSLVDPEKTRFDFSHNKPLTEEELDAIERLCVEQIEKKLPVYAAMREEDFVDQKEARKINTLRAVFGEKYPDNVRVVSIGVPVTEEDAKRAGKSDWLLKSPQNPEWMKLSVEFCGGTHVKNTKEIEAFVLTHEEGVAKGVRRVVGISGDAAKKAIALGDQLLAEAKALGRHEGTEPRRHEGKPPQSPLGKGGGSLAESLTGFQTRLSEAQIPLHVRRQIQAVLVDLQKALKEQEKQAGSESADAVMNTVRSLLENAQTIGGVTVVVGEVPAANADALRAGIDWIRNKTPASAVLLGTVDDNKVTLVAGMSKVAVEKGLKAGDLIKEICPLVGGKGGGRPDMAQGGGPDAAGLPNALEQAMQSIRGKL